MGETETAVHELSSSIPTPTCILWALRCSLLILGLDAAVEEKPLTCSGIQHLYPPEGAGIQQGPDFLLLSHAGCFSYWLVDGL